MQVCSSCPWRSLPCGALPSASSLAPCTTTRKRVGGIWLGWPVGWALLLSSGDRWPAEVHPPTQPAGWAEGPEHRRLSRHGSRFLQHTPGIPQNPSRTSVPGRKRAMCNQGGIAQCPPAYTNSHNSGAPWEVAGAQVRCPMLLMDRAAGPPQSSHPLAMAGLQTSTDASSL